MFELVPFNRRRNQIANRDRNIFDLDQVFENFFNDSVFPSYFSHSGLMKVDIRDDGDKYVLETEIPGVAKENINIDVEEGRLTISVSQNEEKEDRRENYICRERRASAMRRSFNLDNIDADKISAKLENGLLTLELPKVEPKKMTGRKVDIA